MAALFTATYPAMVRKRVLDGSFARFTRAPDDPHSPTLEQVLHVVPSTWGKPTSVLGFSPSRADDAVFCEQVARYQRMTASPSAIKQLMMANDRIDMRAILPLIRRPTLIIHQRGERTVRCANRRFLADHIPVAVYLELPGVDHYFVGQEDADAIVDAIRGFGGSERAREIARQSERWLATALFTDIVGSTDCNRY